MSGREPPETGTDTAEPGPRRSRTVDARPAGQPRRAKHLMDPSNPVRPVNDASLVTVQRWVMSTLAVVTIGHLAVGLALAALTFPESDATGRIGVNLLAGVLWLIAVAAGQLIHHRNPVNAWLLLAVVPTAAGLWLALG